MRAGMAKGPRAWRARFAWGAWGGALVSRDSEAPEGRGPEGLDGLEPLGADVGGLISASVGIRFDLVSEIATMLRCITFKNKYVALGVTALFFRRICSSRYAVKRMLYWMDGPMIIL